MLRINDRFIIGGPAAYSIAVAALALRVPVGVLQRIVQMHHQLRLNIALETLQPNVTASAGVRQAGGCGEGVSPEN